DRNWHSKGSNNLLYWHWSPANDFDMNFPVYGYDEALITYIVSASSPYHPISKELYENSWVKSASWKNGQKYYNITLPLGNFYKGYVAHCPQEDLGVIQPTAALSSFPYTPDFSMQALKHFYYDLGNKIWSQYGFSDGFSETKNWYAKTHLAIDEGPIVVMIENYRTGLLWKLFMNIPDIQNGLKRLGFKSSYIK